MYIETFMLEMGPGLSLTLRPVAEIDGNEPPCDSDLRRGNAAPKPVRGAEVVERCNLNQAQVKRRESGTTSDCKHQSACDAHEHYAEQGTRRMGGGTELGNTGAMVKIARNRAIEAQNKYQCLLLCKQRVIAAGCADLP